RTPHKVSAEVARHAELLYHKVPSGPQLRTRVPKRPRAHVFGLWTDLRDHREQELAEALVVLLEDADHLLVRHRLGTLDADVVVRDHRDVRVAELELPGEAALRVRGHVDHVPAGLLEPARLGAGREARALDDHNRAAVADRDAELAGGL